MKNENTYSYVYFERLEESKEVLLYAYDLHFECTRRWFKIEKDNANSDFEPFDYFVTMGIR
jgi:hypothetical protein